jgi:hypothetical protein
LIFTGSNYRAWKDSIKNYMSMHDDIGYCFTKEEPLKPASSASKKNIENYVHVV